MEATTATQLWPRVIVGVFPEKGSKPAHALVNVALRLTSGQVLTGHIRGCPEIQGVVCSFSFFTAPRDKEALLLVVSRADGSILGRRRIDLSDFNYRGEKIRYVRVYLEPTGSVRIGEPAVISPGAVD